MSKVPEDVIEPEDSETVEIVFVQVSSVQNSILLTFIEFASLFFTVIVNRTSPLFIALV